MNALHIPAGHLTAADVMSRELVTIPRQILVREAARLLHRARTIAAAVVDERGCCVGLLSPADVYRWVDAGCPEAIVGPVLSCPYQVRGRLLTGNEAVICIMAHGSCPYQALQPSTGGRHTELCMRQAHADSPFGTVPGYITTNGVTVRPKAPLFQLVQQMADAHADHLIVVDENERPLGLVSAPDVLSYVDRGGD